MLLGLVLCTCSLSSACSRKSDPEPDLVLTHEILPQPPRVGSASVSIDLTDRDGSPISGAKINVEGNMTHPGMAGVEGEAHEIGSGHYVASLTFSMGGDWVLNVHGRLADGRTLTRQFDVKGVLPE